MQTTKTSVPEGPFQIIQQPSTLRFTKKRHPLTQRSPRFRHCRLLINNFCQLQLELGLLQWMTSIQIQQYGTSYGVSSILLTTISYRNMDSQHVLLKDLRGGLLAEPAELCAELFVALALLGQQSLQVLAARTARTIGVMMIYAQFIPIQYVSNHISKLYMVSVLFCF